jgi:hypothetical protein
MPLLQDLGGIEEVSLPHHLAVPQLEHDCERAIEVEATSLASRD